MFVRPGARYGTDVPATEHASALACTDRVPVSASCPRGPHSALWPTPRGGRPLSSFPVMGSDLFATDLLWPKLNYGRKLGKRYPEPLLLSLATSRESINDLEVKTFQK